MKAPRVSARFGLVLAVLCPALPGFAGHLAAQQPRFELGLAAGFHHYDSQLELANGVGVAGRLGIRIAGPLEIEGEANYAQPHTDTPGRERVGVTTFGGWVLLNQGVGQRASVFLKGGYAGVSFGKCPVLAVGSGPCGSAGVIQGGIGARLAITPAVQLRYDASVNRSVTTLKFSNLTLQAGLALMFGGKRETPASSQPPVFRPPMAAPAPPPTARPEPPAPEPRPAAPPPDTLPAARPAPDTVPAQPKVAVRTEWVLPGSVWPYRGAVLQPEAFPALDSIAAIANADPQVRIEINGFAYDRLIPADDVKLSQFRADAVKSYLTFKGVPVSRITAAGRGSEPLIDQADTEAARTRNRRTEIHLVRPPD